MTDENGHPCCGCCDGIAKDDHVGHGGTVKKDGHDLPCSTCEFEQRIQPRLAQAWDEGHRGLCRRHGFAPFAACVNPYRVIPPGVTP